MNILSKQQYGVKTFKDCDVFLEIPEMKRQVWIEVLFVLLTISFSTLAPVETFIALVVVWFTVSD